MSYILGKALTLFFQETGQIAQLSPVLLEIMKTFATALLVGIVTWLFARRKNTADVHKTESETIKNYVEIISDLQKEIEGWIERVSKLRLDAVNMENANTELKRSVEKVQEIEREKLSSLRLAFKREKEVLYESVSKVLRLAKQIELEAMKYPDYTDLKRETIRIVEFLTWIRDKLEPESVSS